MLIGEAVDALSFIVHKDNSYTRGRKMVEKLKTCIPKQLFSIPLQAVVRRKNYCERNNISYEKRCTCKMLWRRYFQKEKTIRKTKERKEKDETNR